mgnify:CR=1
MCSKKPIRGTRLVADAELKGWWNKPRSSLKIICVAHAESGQHLVLCTTSGLYVLAPAPPLSSLSGFSLRKDLEAVTRTREEVVAVLLNAALLECMK